MIEILLDKIRIAYIPKNSVQWPENHNAFYKSYADYVKKTLNKTLFQRFLRWLMKKENIDNNLIKDVQIRIFPSQKKNGNKLAGKWNKHGNIFIFPKSYEFYKKLEKKHGRKTAHSYVKCRARATLIHEILHAKYSSDEDKVRKLTESYYNLYAGNPRTENFKKVVSKILFQQ